MKRRFIQCDVFTSVPGRGNALAVVLDSEGISEEQMQAFAAWTNLAETTFLLPPTDDRADYRVRIFTPVREMPFAGHPTLGSCAAWSHAGGRARSSHVIVQECAIGLVEIDITGQWPAFVAPPTKIEAMPAEDLKRLADAMAIDLARILNAARLNNGPQWQVLELASADAVLGIDSSRVAWPKFQPIGLIGRHSAGAECDYEVRMLASPTGMSEDPITGSLNAAIARWFEAGDRLADRTLIAQGTSIAREGRVLITRAESDPTRVLIGGQSHIMIEGTLKL